MTLPSTPNAGLARAELILRAALGEAHRGVAPTTAIAERGAVRTRSHCRFAPPLIHFIPDSLT
jgi:hypothetical protein